MGGAHPYLVTSVKEIKASQNRAEELLMELIYERLLSTKPTEDPNQLGEPITDHYKGYCEGWWDAVETLRNAIDNRIEENELRINSFKQ